MAERVNQTINQVTAEDAAKLSGQLSDGTIDQANFVLGIHNLFNTITAVYGDVIEREITLKFTVVNRTK